MARRSLDGTSAEARIPTMSDFIAFSPRVGEIDLGPIKYKLVNPDDGLGWSLAKADLIEMEYRQFLDIVLTNGGEVIVPSKDVDKFWHAHILDTRKYASDCQSIFGFFLHHFPYLGSRGAADKKVLASEFEKSTRLMAWRFEDPVDGMTNQRESAVCGGGDGGGRTRMGGAISALNHCVDLETRPSL